MADAHCVAFLLRVKCSQRSPLERSSAGLAVLSSGVPDARPAGALLTRNPFGKPSSPIGSGRCRSATSPPTQTPRCWPAHAGPATAQAASGSCASAGARSTFVQRDALSRLRARFKQAVAVASHDIRTGPPDGPFEMIMCRNLVFTYFHEQQQLTVGARLADCLRPGGVLVLGGHERAACKPPLPGAWGAAHGVYRRSRTPDGGRCPG